MTLPFRFACVLIISTLWVSCYNFKGISIPAELNTYYVDNFTLTKADAPAGLNQLFTERLREKIREESRLVNDNDNPDITFSGAISDYNLGAAAPQEGNTVGLNRLQIVIKVNYTDETNNENNWSKSYTAFTDFDVNQDFYTIQEELIENLIEDIVERIFNDSFTNW